MKLLLLLISVLAIALHPIAAFAQRDAPAPSGAPKPPPHFVYDVGSRRDPFQDLVNRGTEAKPEVAKTARPRGVAGVAVDEVAVRGIVQSQGAWVAMIAAPNGRSYTIRPGDRLLDGSVRTITGEAVLLSQDITDPLSHQKRRDVRKSLRGEVKE